MLFQAAFEEMSDSSGESDPENPLEPQDALEPDYEPEVQLQQEDALELEEPLVLEEEEAAQAQPESPEAIPDPLKALFAQKCCDFKPPQTEPCLSLVDVEQAFNHILCMRELTQSEKELYIMGQLHPISTSNTTRKGQRKKVNYTYRYFGLVLINLT